MVWQVRFEPPVSVSVHLGPTSIDWGGGGGRGERKFCDVATLAIVHKEI